jgi:hypothetical protein
MVEILDTDLPGSRTIPWDSSGKTYPLASGIAGVFYVNSKTSAADITDGLSNTALVSEVRVVDGNDYRGVMHLLAGCHYHHNSTPNSSNPDWLRTDNCVSVPDALCQGTYNGWVPNVIVTARSAHAGGVNLLLGDASVRFVSDSINLNVWQALATPKALPGEVVSIGDF